MGNIRQIGEKIKEGKLKKRDKSLIFDNKSNSYSFIKKKVLL